MEIPNEKAYKQLVENLLTPKEKEAIGLSLEQRLQVDTLRTLNSINGKLTFFVILAIAAIVVQIIF